MSLPSEIRQKVKALEINTRKLVNTQLCSLYSSVFRGQGMIFSDFREYIPGDEVRSISWPLTARMGKPYIKQYEEERELSVILAVDISASGHFGSQDQLKIDIMAHLSALIGFAASKNRDSVGLILFSDQIECYIPPKKSSGNIQKILHTIYGHKPRSKKTSLKLAIDFLEKTLKKRSIVFFFSDFLDDGYLRSMQSFSNRHDVIALQFLDPLEENLPPVGLLKMRDPETGRVVVMDTSSPFVRRDFAQMMRQNQGKVQKTLSRAGVGRVMIRTDQDFVDPLVKFFKQRRGRS